MKRCKVNFRVQFSFKWAQTGVNPVGSQMGLVWHVRTCTFTHQKSHLHTRKAHAQYCKNIPYLVPYIKLNKHCNKTLHLTMRVILPKHVDHKYMLSLVWKQKQTGVYPTVCVHNYLVRCSPVWKAWVQTRVYLIRSRTRINQMQIALT